VPPASAAEPCTYLRAAVGAVGAAAVVLMGYLRMAADTERLARHHAITVSSGTEAKRGGWHRIVTASNYLAGSFPATRRAL
jgi:hypothetical protein